MSKNTYLWLASVALLLAGCSRTGTIQSASAQSPSPEPVDRTLSAQSQPMPAQSTPPQGMYAPPQAATQAAQTPSAPPLYASQPASVPPANGEQPATAYPQPTEPVAAPPASEPPSNPPPVEPASVRTYDGPIIPVGTRVRVRLDESLGTKHDRTGERFYASLANPIVMDGRTLLPAGTRFVGHLIESKPSGRLKGRAILAVRLDAFDWRGRQYSIDTSDIARSSRNHKRHNLGWIGGGGALGAAIGAIGGGGGGALIGAAAGAGAGTAGALISGKKQVHLSAETALTFRLRRPVQL